MTLQKDEAIRATLLGDWINATSINKALIKKNPKDVDALNRLAYAFAILGKIRDAKLTYKKVLKIDVLNQIAIRNMKKLAGVKSKQITKNYFPAKYVDNIFLEETGKTKIISLVNTAQPKVITLLTTGQPVVITVKRLKIFVQDQNAQYIGVLPDDIGKRLIKLIKAGNIYGACIKSISEHSVCIFIREIKRVSRYKNQPSFPQSQDQNLSLSKDNKAKMGNFKKPSESNQIYSSNEES